ncbi:hypothetical protein M426DRAFT_25189 [Hypoxylon sp. CI-4A]|nr:hypothetical protein M426DRAFT_25189 [Hypoxylon sp. CI-4A]
MPSRSPSEPRPRSSGQQGNFFNFESGPRYSFLAKVEIFDGNEYEPTKRRSRSSHEFSRQERPGSSNKRSRTPSGLSGSTANTDTSTTATVGVGTRNSAPTPAQRPRAPSVSSTRQQRPTRSHASETGDTDYYTALESLPQHFNNQLNFHDTSDEREFLARHMQNMSLHDTHDNCNHTARPRAASSSTTNSSHRKREDKPPTRAPPRGPKRRPGNPFLRPSPSIRNYVNDDDPTPWLFCFMRPSFWGFGGARDDPPAPPRPPRSVSQSSAPSSRYRR